MAEILTRWQHGIINKVAGERRVLLLAGPRQCGKTTLARLLESERVEYRSLDDDTLRELATTDPTGFVQHDRDMLIIDEIQHVLPLLPAIKQVVDNDNRPGQFLLTGSANIRTLPGVQESLAGRIAEIRLRTLAPGEIAGTAPGFLADCFAMHGWANRKSCSCPTAA